VHPHADAVDACVTHLHRHRHDRAGVDEGQQGSNHRPRTRSVLLQGTSFQHSPSQSLNTNTRLQADTSAFRADPDNVLEHLPADIKTDNNLLEALKGAASSKELKDFYKVGLWSYCEGDKDEKTGVETITYCSKSKTNFWFDPFSVWELKDTSAQKVLGDDLQKGLDTYKKVAGWMVWAFGIALILSAAEFIIGFFAIFSRWGSLVTTIVSTVSSPPIPNIARRLWC
jgi:hypothetical protein